jgi:fatty-acyl-CoA synthase
MMNFQLTLSAVIRRAATLFPGKTVTTRTHDGSLHRVTYAELINRARQLSLALTTLGIKPGDKVGTLAWNTHLHLEAYLGIPSAGAVLHTLNLRLHPDELAYVINDADDRAVIVDPTLLPLLEQVRSRIRVPHIIVMDASSPDGMIPYEQFLASETPARFVDRDPDEESAAAMCYTSGTTGRPKGVVYSHRAIVLHSLVHGVRDCLDIGEADVVCPAVPMFHVNAWGLPFTALLFGASQVLPGRFLDAPNLLDLMSRERVTITAGVPTIWMSVLKALDEEPTRYHLASLRMIINGGSAAPPAMIRAFDRHGLRLVQAWGMTETTPFGSACLVPSRLANAPDDEVMAYRSMQGLPLPLVEFRAATESGIVPWDGCTMGELQVRGPWVVDRYYNGEASDERFTADGWFRTGDIVTIDPTGCIRITDRSKDLVKSGGEWISSVALEGALMGHPAVSEAAVVAVPHPKWSERPLAVVVLKPLCSVSVAELQALLSAQFPKFWIPESVEFVSAIPRNSSGKFLKSALRDQFRSYYDHADDRPLNLTT